MDEEHPITAAQRPLDTARIEDAVERVEGHWLVFDYPGNPTIRLDARLLDRVFVDDGTIVVSVDDVNVRMTISSGEPAARAITNELQSFTRSAPITRPEVYEDALRRLAIATRRSSDPLPPVLLFGDAAVQVGQRTLSVGNTHFWISDVEHYAQTGRELPLPNGVLQAALATLILADRKRIEDAVQLSRRVAEYEAKLSC